MSIFGARMCERNACASHYLFLQMAAPASGNATGAQSRCKCRYKQVCVSIPRSHAILRRHCLHLAQLLPH